MHNRASHLIVTVACALGAVVAAGAAFAQTGGQQPGTTVAYTTELKATVESVDLRTRQVVLRGPGGQLVEMTAGPAIENLSRVKPGDRVSVRYIEALAASLAKPGQGSDNLTTQEGIARSAPGNSSPSATVGTQVRATVTIQAIDHATHTVTFTGPDNIPRAVMVRDPDAQRFVDTLGLGDRVDLVYTDSLAVAVEPSS